MRDIRVVDKPIRQNSVPLSKALFSSQVSYNVLEDSIIRYFSLSITFGITRWGKDIVDLVGGIYIFDLVTSKLLKFFYDQSMLYAEPSYDIVLNELPGII